MSNIHAKNCFVALLNAAGASKMIYSDGNNVTFTETIENPTITAFGDVAVQRSGSGLQDAKFTYEGWANDESASGNLAMFAALKGIQTSIVVAPNGSGAGSSCPVKYAASVILDDYEIGMPVAGIVTVRASFSIMNSVVEKSTSWTTAVS